MTDEAESNPPPPPVLPAPASSRPRATARTAAARQTARREGHTERPNANDRPLRPQALGHARASSAPSFPCMCSWVGPRNELREGRVRSRSGATAVKTRELEVARS